MKALTFSNWNIRSLPGILHSVLTSSSAFRNLYIYRFTNKQSWVSGMILIIFTLIIRSPSSLEADTPKYQPGKILSKMLVSPMSNVDEIIFATRVSGRDHWYVNFGYYSSDEIANVDKKSFGRSPDGQTMRGYGDGGRLSKLNLRTGDLVHLIDDPKGGVRDPQMHYDGKKILFSYRKGGTETYHLYEINIDGTSLTQLTDGPDDDVEPTYLPGGKIMFSSSRNKRYVNCWLTRVASLYCCDNDGKNIRMISSNIEHDNTPWMMPDGQVLYMRWEYVDRSQVNFHHLWTTNPDGTNQMVWFGNETPGITMIDAKPISGTHKVIASFSPGHGKYEHAGYVTVVDPNGGPDVSSKIKRISKGEQVYRDPYAITEECILVADKKGISLMDGEGNTELLYALPESDRRMECHEPRPVRSRKREPVIRSEVDLSQPTGHMVLANIYNGRSMQGVKKGEIKNLLVLEQLPKPVNFSGGQEPLSLGGTFTLARILGTIPVEKDGSAYMELPALRSLFFVTLDKNNASVTRMQSFITLQPGELTSCVGCHEQRSRTAKVELGLMALKSPPHQIKPIKDVPEVLDYPRDIQPILNKHCIQCHNPNKMEGQIDMTGDHTPVYSVSYWTMISRGLITDGRNRPDPNYAPRSIGSSASPLMKLIDGQHYQTKLSDNERKLIRLWIETSGTYPGTYAALGSGMFPVDLPLTTMQSRCANCHHVAAINNPHEHYQKYRVYFGPLNKNYVPEYLRYSPWQAPFMAQSRCNLTRPDKSILLRAPLAKHAGGLGLCKGDIFKDRNDADYQIILKTIEDASTKMKQAKRFDMPGFRPNKHYIREMQRFGILKKDLPVNAPIDIYKTDQYYWQSFWYHPPKKK